VNFSKVVQLIFYLVYDPFKKKQEMETNPKSLPSNLTFPGFFTIGVLVYKKKKFKTPPPQQTWGYYFLRVGPLASNTQAPKPVSYAKSGSEWI